MDGGSNQNKDLDELEEARKERDEIRRMIRKENERERRREVAGKNRTKEERENTHLSGKMDKMLQARDLISMLRN